MSGALCRRERFVDQALGRITISTRRFCALPDGVRLLATGWLSPRPITRIRVRHTRLHSAKPTRRSLPAARRVAGYSRVAVAVGMPDDLDGGVGILTQVASDSMQVVLQVGAAEVLSVANRMSCGSVTIRRSPVLVICTLPLPI